VLFRQNDYNQLGSSAARKLGSSEGSANLQIRQLDNLAAWICHTVYRQLGSLASWQYGSLGNRQRGRLLAVLQLGEVHPGINPSSDLKGLSISTSPPGEVLKSSIYVEDWSSPVVIVAHFARLLLPSIKPDN
jgi:hypothetical protein